MSPADQKNQKPELRGMNKTEIESVIQKAGFKGFRSRQVFHWLYQRDARSFDEMANIPSSLRNFLSENYRIGSVKISETLTSSDGAMKILSELHDGLKIESVLMPKDERRTLCISSQVGCRLGCDFCLTARVGLIRNLTAAEIIDQVQCVKREILGEKQITNVVVMGMGEPLMNMNALVPALKLMTSPDAVVIPTRRVTVSTAGYVPGIYELAEADTGVNLAISLNAPNDTLRSRLMPINRKYPIKKILEACRAFPITKKRRITFEYIMLKDVNDAPEHAEQLAKLLRGIKCKINLIRYNEEEQLPYKASSLETIDKFAGVLVKHNYIVAVRHSMGQDIKAACGQLAAGYLKEKDDNE